MSNGNHSSLLPYYQNLLPKSIYNDHPHHSTKKPSKRCSSSYRQRLKRLQTNCELIRRRRQFRVNPIELRPSLFQQRSYQSGSLESLNINETHWQSTNILRLSDEYLYKCKYATYSSTHRIFTSNEFDQFLRDLFSYSCNSKRGDYDRNCCQLCQHRFSSKETYDLHLNRRSISIDYRCFACQSSIKAENPCQAYSHVFSHSKETRIGQLNIHYDQQNSLTFLAELFSKYSE